MKTYKPLGFALLDLPNSTSAKYMTKLNKKEIFLKKKKELGDMIIKTINNAVINGQYFTNINLGENSYYDNEDMKICLKELSNKGYEVNLRKNEANHNIYLDIRWNK